MYGVSDPARRLAVALLAIALLASAVVPLTGAGQLSGPAAATAAVDEDACTGEVTGRPDGPTLVSVQGVRFTDDGAEKTAGYVASFAPDGSIQWVHNNSDRGRWWTYDVDPLPNGDLLIAGTVPGSSYAERYDPVTGEFVWQVHLEDVGDAHDVDLINGDELLIADKAEDENRLAIYNLTREEYTWEWSFEGRYPHDGGGDYPEDWTHVNDVDKIGNGLYMASPRNFDQVIAVNRSTKEIVWRLGEDDDYAVMNEQHNPQYLQSENGTPTVLIADSRNDRVVEYARQNGEWVQTWALEGGGLHAPRDADRLPNGNTLIADRYGQRTLEITPTGEVVWEVYTPWQTYDAERPGLGDEPPGPTSTDLEVRGTFTLDSEAVPEGDLEACAAALTDFEGDTWETPVTPAGEDGPTYGADDWTGPGDVSDSTDGGDTDEVDPRYTTVGTTPTPTDSFSLSGASVAAIVGVVALLGALLWVRRVR